MHCFCGTSIFVMRQILSASQRSRKSTVSLRKKSLLHWAKPLAVTQTNIKTWPHREHCRPLRDAVPSWFYSDALRKCVQVSNLWMCCKFNRFVVTPRYTLLGHRLHVCSLYSVVMFALPVSTTLKNNYEMLVCECILWYTELLCFT